MTDRVSWRNRIVGHGVKPADQFQANPDNWRGHPQHQREAVRGSLNELGWVDTVIENVTTGHVVDGHERIWQALQNDNADVPYIQVELTEEEERLALAILDPITNMATTDAEKLDALLADIRTDDAALQAMLSELAKGAGLSFGEEPAEDPGPQLDRAEELQEKWGVKRGDVWECGDGVWLICGDCREAETWERLLSAAGVEKVNGVFTSPLYAEQRKEQYGGVPVDEYVGWWEAVQANVRMHLANDGSFFVNIKPHCEDGERVLYVMDLVLAMRRRWGWRFVDELCWYKKAQPGGWSNRFRNDWESIFQFCLNKHIAFYPWSVSHYSDDAVRGTGGMPKTSQGNYGIDESWRTSGQALPGNVLEVSTKLANQDASLPHSAAFPVALASFFVKAYSDTNDVWCDPFAGSFTTGIAAHQNDRRFVGIEILEKYCAVGLERMAGLGLAPRLVGGDS